MHALIFSVISGIMQLQMHLFFDHILNSFSSNLINSLHISAISADVAQLLLNQEQLGNIQYVGGENVQMIVDEATAAAVLTAAGEGGQEYQVRSNFVDLTV